MKTPTLDMKQLALEKRSKLDQSFRKLRIAIVEVDTLLEFISMGYIVHKQHNGWYINFREV